MERAELLGILAQYGVDSLSGWREIDSTNQGDYRLNVIVDNKYVLRVNNPVITEERLASISRLCERYRSIGVETPRLYRNASGQFLTPHESHVCYLSDYLDYQTEKEAEETCDHEQVGREVLASIGRLSSRFSGVDLSPVNSMWSLIDLAPLDVDVDEKQENLDMLVEALEELGESDLAREAAAFNEAKRERIRAVYKQLPRCVIQGDLNWSNILVKDSHFVGLIDFNMSGTEVNVNHFCAETNGGISEEDFTGKAPEDLYSEWLTRQNAELDVILQEYSMNGLEQSVLEDYRSICLISQYPNVMAFLKFLKMDRAKAVDLIRLILQR